MTNQQLRLEHFQVIGLQRRHTVLLYACHRKISMHLSFQQHVGCLHTKISYNVPALSLHRIAMELLSKQLYRSQAMLC